jgi:hypothetical protein
MPQKPFDVGRLSDARVNSLLALGLSRGSFQENAADLLAGLSGNTRSHQLQLLWSDLESPVLVPDAGLISFPRLTGLPAEDARTLAGKTFREVLTSLHTSRSVLEHLATLGDILLSDPMPISVRRAGTVIRILAASALYARFGVVLKGYDPTQAVEIIRVLEMWKAVSPSESTGCTTPSPSPKREA